MSKDAASSVPQGGGNYAAIASEFKKQLEKSGVKPKTSNKWKPKGSSKLKHVNLHETFEGASSNLHDQIVGLADEQLDKPVLFVTTPGIGKTEGGIHLASNLAKTQRRPFIGVTTRNMAWQVYERLKGGFYGYGHIVIMLEGRHDGYVRRRLDDEGYIEEIKVHANCHNYDKICKAREKGYPAQHFVCARCPFYPHYKDNNGEKTGFGGACEYFKNIYRAAGFVPVGDGGWQPIVVTTHHMLGNLICEGEIMKEAIDFVLIDEDPLPAFREIYGWNTEELDRDIDGDALVKFRALLRHAQNVADKYRYLANAPMSWMADKEKKEPGGAELLKALIDCKVFDNSIVWGKALALVLKKAAGELGVDLIPLLNEAATCETGVKKGEFNDMPEWRFQRLPHHKEPDVAAEILNIVNQSNEDKETAYKVSLRWDASTGWTYFWDSVRRIKYGGPLVLLDAYGEKEISDRVCNREVEVREVHCKVRKNVTVKRYPDVKTSRAVMDKKKDQIFDQYVDPELRQLKGMKVLFYTQKRYAEWLEERIKANKDVYGMTNYVIKWFWMDRGDDSYGDYDAIVIVGSPFSNVIAERNFCNAVFAGEEPLNWDTKKPGFTPVDDRVRVHKEARQEKELLQALFRIRPSKPREKPQRIVIFSAMKLNIYLEMPGVINKVMHQPDVNRNDIYSSIHKIFKAVGGWTDAFSAFINRHHQFVNWWEVGGIKSDQEFFTSYESMVHMVAVVRAQGVYPGVRQQYLEEMRGIVPQMVKYGRRNIRIWGDSEKVVEVLDQLKAATREPGIDDDEHYEDDAEETAQAQPEVESLLPAHVDEEKTPPPQEEHEKPVNEMDFDLDEYADSLVDNMPDPFAGGGTTPQYPEKEFFDKFYKDYKEAHQAASGDGGPSPPDDEDPGAPDSS